MTDEMIQRFYQNQEQFKQNKTLYNQLVRHINEIERQQYLMKPKQKYNYYQQDLLDQLRNNGIETEQQKFKPRFQELYNDQFSEEKQFCMTHTVDNKKYSQSFTKQEAFEILFDSFYFDNTDEDHQCDKNTMFSDAQNAIANNRHVKYDKEKIKRGNFYNECFIEKKNRKFYIDIDIKSGSMDGAIINQQYQFFFDKTVEFCNQFIEHITMLFKVKDVQYNVYSSQPGIQNKDEQTKISFHVIFNNIYCDNYIYMKQIIKQFVREIQRQEDDDENKKLRELFYDSIDYVVYQESQCLRLPLQRKMYIPYDNVLFPLYSNYLVNKRRKIIKQIDQQKIDRLLQCQNPIIQTIARNINIPQYQHQIMDAFVCFYPKESKTMQLITDGRSLTFEEFKNNEYECVFDELRKLQCVQMTDINVEYNIEKIHLAYVQLCYKKLPELADQCYSWKRFALMCAYLSAYNKNNQDKVDLVQRAFHHFASQSDKYDRKENEQMLQSFIKFFEQGYNFSFQKFFNEFSPQSLNKAVGIQAIYDNYEEIESKYLTNEDKTQTTFKTDILSPLQLNKDVIIISNQGTGKTELLCLLSQKYDTILSVCPSIQLSYTQLYRFQEQGYNPIHYKEIKKQKTDILNEIALRRQNKQKVIIITSFSSLHKVPFQNIDLLVLDEIMLLFRSFINQDFQELKKEQNLKSLKDFQQSAKRTIMLDADYSIQDFNNFYNCIQYNRDRMKQTLFIQNLYVKQYYNLLEKLGLKNKLIGKLDEIFERFAQLNNQDKSEKLTISCKSKKLSQYLKVLLEEQFNIKSIVFTSNQKQSDGSELQKENIVKRQSQKLFIEKNEIQCVIYNMTFSVGVDLNLDMKNHLQFINDCDKYQFDDINYRQLMARNRQIEYLGIVNFTCNTFSGDITTKHKRNLKQLTQQKQSYIHYDQEIMKKKLKIKDSYFTNMIEIKREDITKLSQEMQNGISEYVYIDEKGESYLCKLSQIQLLPEDNDEQKQHKEEQYKKYNSEQEEHQQYIYDQMRQTIKITLEDLNLYSNTNYDVAKLYLLQQDNKDIEKMIITNEIYKRKCEGQYNLDIKQQLIDIQSQTTKQSKQSKTNISAQLQVLEVYAEILIKIHNNKMSMGDIYASMNEQQIFILTGKKNSTFKQFVPKCSSGLSQLGIVSKKEKGLCMFESQKEHDPLNIIV